MENQKKTKIIDYIKANFYFYCWILQISLWVFDALLISNLVRYGDFVWFEYSHLINMIIFFYVVCNYFMYLLINAFYFLYYIGMKNQLTDSELINKIQNQINDNSFNDSIIKYECYHILQGGEQRNDNYKYRESDDESKTLVITKSDSMNYSFKSMRDISGTISLKTYGYTNMQVYINISVAMDNETKKDFEDVKKRFFADYKNSDKLFNQIITHNFELNRKSDFYVVKVNGGKASFLYNKYFFAIISILGFAEIIKIILRFLINKGTQTINIKKIISSKYDLNDPYVIQMLGYDRLSTSFYVNDNFYGNNNFSYDNKGNDKGLAINEKLLP